ncbi:MAG TPA: family 16 glycoside hydrolase, partial [bacterium]|nr:family 16 glycoside hydrolase [bacterium]
MGRLHIYSISALSVLAACLFAGVPPLFAQISLTKSVNVAGASNGAALTYTLNYSNAGAPTTCSDSFGGDSLGVIPSGWTQNISAWTVVSDTTDAPATQAAKGVAPAGQYPLLLNSCAGQVGDGTIQADMKISAAGQQGVLLWRFTGTNVPSFVNGSNYQADIATGTANNVSVNYYDNGGTGFHNIATGSANINAGAWNTILLQVTGTGSGTVTFSLSVNGTQVIAPTTTSFNIGSGQAGLQANSGSTVEFTKVSIVKFTQTYNVTVTDTLPAGFTYVSSNGSPSVSGQKLVWNLGTLANGASGALTVSGMSAAGCGTTLVNTGEADSGLPLQSVVSAPVSTTITGCTATPTGTPIRTATYTPSATASSTPTATPSFTPFSTSTFTATPTPTFTPSSTPTVTATLTATNTASLTPTLTPSLTPTLTVTLTPTATPSNTATATLTFTPSSTPTATRTVTPSATASQTPTNTSTQTGTNTVTATATLTATLTPSSTPTNLATDTASNTPSVTATHTPTKT